MTQTTDPQNNEGAHRATEAAPAQHDTLLAPLPPTLECERLDLLLVAGEHSGDEHAATMLREALLQQPKLRVAALGGPKLAAAGAHLLHDLTATSVVGFVEVLSHAGFFRRLFHDIIAWIARYRPKAICLIDYPGFNLRLAAALRERGLSVAGGGDVRVLYYISPQIWAWKAHRRFSMARDLDALAVIFPFEVACYADTRLPVEFVGHPFVAPGYEAPVREDPAGPILLLPGSRRQAVRRIFPALLQGYQTANTGREAVVLYPSDTIRRVLEAATLPATVRLLRTGTPIAASAVLTSSGTMSMHCALAGLPGAIAYRTNPWTYLIGRMLVRTPYIGIANLLLQQPMYPEYIQGASRPERLAGELHACLDGPERRLRTLHLAKRLHELLRQPASGTAADWLLRHCSR